MDKPIHSQPLDHRVIEITTNLFRPAVDQNSHHAHPWETCLCHFLGRDRDQFHSPVTGWATASLAIR